ncbi:hypothetical protein ACC692_38320, partial [Rhizobium ruizarguesonis]
VREAYPRLSHRYYKMKAKCLGMEQMNFWDRNAPLPETSSAIISLSLARVLVIRVKVRIFALKVSASAMADLRRASGSFS